MPCQACIEFKEKHVRYKVQSIYKGGPGNPSDYSYPCTTPIFADCDMAGLECYSSDECSNLGYCRATTCPSPLPNSHYVSKTCVATYRRGTCNICRAEICGATGLCDVTGSCLYDCDAGRVWNPVTLTCDLIAVAAVSGGSNIFPWISAILSYLRQKKRKKRRVIASILT